MNNKEIRRAARIAGVPLYQIAADVSISEATLSRWLRFELSEDREALLMSAIKKREDQEQKEG